MGSLAQKVWTIIRHNETWAVNRDKSTPDSGGASISVAIRRAASLAHEEGCDITEILETRHSEPNARPEIILILTPRRTP